MSNMSKEEFERRFDEIYHNAKYTDRGSKKWQGMFLTEHVKELRKDEADSDKVNRPELDEFDLQTMQEEVVRALTSKLETRITSWKDGYLHYHQGAIRELSTKFLTYEDPFGNHKLDISEIVEVMILE